MKQLSETVNRFLVYRLPALLFAFIPVMVLADELDPTIPSLELRALMPTKSSETLSSGPTKQLEERILSPPQLRIQGLVFRDQDNGTALIKFGDSETRSVTLRREKIGSPEYRLRFGEMVLEVKDFSDTFIVLQSVDGNLQLIVN